MPGLIESTALPVLESRPFNLESSALTITPPLLPVRADNDDDDDDDDDNNNDDRDVEGGNDDDDDE